MSNTIYNEETVGYLRYSVLKNIADAVYYLQSGTKETDQTKTHYDNIEEIIEFLESVSRRTDLVESKDADGGGTTITALAGYYPKNVSINFDATAADSLTNTLTLTRFSDGVISVNADATQPKGYVSTKRTKNASKSIYLVANKGKVEAREGSKNGAVITSQSVATGTLEYPRITIDTSVNDSSIKITADSTIQDPGYLPYDAAESSSATITLSANGATVYAKTESGQVGKCSVTTATQATPTITIDNKGKVTAKCTQSAGYVSSGDKSSLFDTMPYLCAPDLQGDSYFDAHWIDIDSSSEDFTRLLFKGSVYVKSWQGYFSVDPMLISIPSYDTTVYGNLIIRNGAAFKNLFVQFKKSKISNRYKLYIQFSNNILRHIGAGSIANTTTNHVKLTIYDASNFSGII